jgi:hypothetical protein
MLNLNNVPADNERQVKPRFQPGIYENVIVSGIREGKTVNGKNIISVTFLGVNGEEITVDWSMEGGAVEYTTRKIKHMLTKVATEDQANSCTSLDQVARLLTGKPMRIKFVGSEYVNKENQVRVKTEIGLPNFAESMKTSTTMLRFDANNNYDIKRLPADQLPQSESTMVAKASNDLPF